MWMNKWFCGMVLVLGWLASMAWSQSATPESFEVGWRWEYRHEGPRPGDMEPNVIDGQRILRVISTADEPAGKQWIMEERFTHSPRVVSRLHVSQERLLTRVELRDSKGQALQLRYEPAIPYPTPDLAVGAKRTIETTLKVEGADFSLPATTTTERLEDETVTTPAGEFAGCRRYRTTTLSTIDVKIGKIRTTEERDQWFHDSVHGMVKEVYRRGAVKFLTWSRPAYTATSTLTAFGKDELPPVAEPLSQTESAAAPSVPPSSASPRTPLRWIISAGAAILVLGGLLVIRRTKRRRNV